MIKKYRPVLFAVFLCILCVANLFAQEMTIGTNFWDQAWGGADPWENGRQSAIVADSVDQPGYNPWRQEFIEEISFYSVLRFMDYGRINNNQDEVYWEDRTKKTDVDQSRMALYWMIDLCNRADSDLWICFPEKSTLGYWQNAADMIRQRLDPGLKVYVEWSNETWNPQFSAYQTGIDSGKVYDLWFPGDQGQSWGEQRLSGRYTAFVNVRIWETFENMFGDDFDDRVVKVLSGSAGNDWWDATLANALTDDEINPAGIIPDVFAIAPYVGVDDGSSQDILERMYNQMSNTENNIKKVRSVLDGTSEWTGQMPPHNGMKSVPLVCYEAGQHIVTNSASFAVNPQSYSWYMDYLDMLNTYIQGPVAHYTHSGHWGNMAWGAKNHIGQYGGEAPKFIALNNWHILNVLDEPGPLVTLNVAGGNGSGTYHHAMFTYIEADSPAVGEVFDKWIGDTSFVTDVSKAVTSIRIPDRDLSVEATFKEAPAATRFEAELAELSGVQVSSERAGYSGTGYVVGSSFDEDNDKITFRVNVDSPGTYNLRIGYGGFYGEKYQFIYVNGIQLSYFYFPPTTDWDTIEYGLVDLNAGLNEIAIVKSWGWIDVDYIEIDGEGLLNINGTGSILIDQFHLYDNYPNPFNPSTIIKYKLPESCNVILSVYNPLGQLIDIPVNEMKSRGLHRLHWDGTEFGLSSGIYYYRISTDNFSAAKRMILLK